VFLAIYSGEPPINPGDANKHLTFIRCIPSDSGTLAPENLAALSPRFAELHHQAQVAREHDLYDLAAIGYRTALEVLLKYYNIFLDLIDAEYSINHPPISRPKSN
jgi:hypothetical protein